MLRDFIGALSGTERKGGTETWIVLEISGIWWYFNVILQGGIMRYLGLSAVLAS